MPYCTQFSLRVHAPGKLSPKKRKEADELADHIADAVVSEYQKKHGTRFSDIFSCPISWSDHEELMRKISQRFPGVIIALDGSGDSSDDLWIKYFRDGSMQLCEARIVYPKFDAKKLS